MKKENRQMLKAKINNALYCRVELTDFENETHFGWLVPSPYNKKEYMILPFLCNKSKVSFNASMIKSIKHLSNGVVLK